MATSANVTEYTIYKDKKEVGHFRKHHLTKWPDYAELLKYQPLSEYDILPWGYGYEDEYWEGKKQNLENYLQDMKSYNKRIKDFFESIKTAEQILQELKEEQEAFLQTFKNRKRVH